MNSFKSRTLFTFCPICGRDDFQGIMEHHVIGHMRSIALKSLPAIYDDYGSEDETDNGDNTTTSSVLCSGSLLNETPQNLDWDMWEGNEEYMYKREEVGRANQTEIHSTQKFQSGGPYHDEIVVQEIEGVGGRSASPKDEKPTIDSTYPNDFAVRERRDFPCVLALYGCTKSFSTKNEWKRHISTQHIRLGVYRCDLCPTTIDSHDTSYLYYNDFNRRDLFLQHLRRMHMAQHSGNRGLPAHPVTEENIDEHRERCYHTIRTAPPQSACLFCDEEFRGPQSWDVRMEHVARHFVKEAGKGPVDVSMWRHDLYLESWMFEEGIITRNDAGEWDIGDGRPRWLQRDNDDKHNVRQARCGG
jgi:hypothetical protein